MPMAASPPAGTLGISAAAVGGPAAGVPVGIMPIDDAGVPVGGAPGVTGAFGVLMGGTADVATASPAVSLSRTQ